MKEPTINNNFNMPAALYSVVITKEPEKVLEIITDLISGKVEVESFSTIMLKQEPPSYYNLLQVTELEELFDCVTPLVALRREEKNRDKTAYIIKHGCEHSPMTSLWKYCYNGNQWLIENLLY